MSRILRSPAMPGYAVALACVLLAALLGQTMPKAEHETAQLPDAGAQRNAMITELRAANQKLAEIAALLKQIRDQGGGQGQRSERQERPGR